MRGVVSDRLGQVPELFPDPDDGGLHVGQAGEVPRNVACPGVASVPVVCEVQCVVQPGLPVAEDSV